MFTTTSGALFGGPPPRSSSGVFNSVQDGKKASDQSAHASAAALLQKAAQMGATASSNSMNSSMVQKGYVTSMAGPDYSREPKLAVAGIGGGGGEFSNLLFQKGPQEISPYGNVEPNSDGRKRWSRSE